MMKDSIQQEEDTTIVNIYTANRAATKYIQQILPDIDEGIDRNTIF